MDEDDLSLLLKRKPSKSKSKLLDAFGEDDISLPLNKHKNVNNTEKNDIENTSTTINQNPTSLSQDIADGDDFLQIKKKKNRPKNAGSISSHLDLPPPAPTPPVPAPKPNQSSNPRQDAPRNPFSNNPPAANPWSNQGRTNSSATLSGNLSQRNQNQSKRDPYRSTGHSNYGDKRGNQPYRGGQSASNTPQPSLFLDDDDDDDDDGVHNNHYNNKSTTNSGDDPNTEQSRMTHREKARLDRLAQASAWEDERFDYATGASSRRIDLDMIEHDKGETRQEVYADPTPPPFLVSRGVGKQHLGAFTGSDLQDISQEQQQQQQQSDTITKDMLDLTTINNEEVPTLVKQATVRVCREMRGDIMKMAREGSILLREYKKDKDRNTNKDKFWEAKGNHIGKLMGIDNIVTKSDLDDAKALQDIEFGQIGGYAGDPTFIMRQLRIDAENREKDRKRDIIKLEKHVKDMKPTTITTASSASSSISHLVDIKSKHDVSTHTTNIKVLDPTLSSSSPDEQPLMPTLSNTNPPPQQQYTTPQEKSQPPLSTAIPQPSSTLSTPSSPSPVPNSSAFDSIPSSSSDSPLDPATQHALERLKIRQVRDNLPVFQYRSEILSLARQNQVLIVVGETGSGKTTQLAQYFYEAGYTSVPPVWTPAMGYGNTIKSSYKRPGGASSSSLSSSSSSLSSSSSSLSSSSSSDTKTPPQTQEQLDQRAAGQFYSTFDYRRIGITQPRRVAATSVAARVAEEMDCQLGHTVGYAIRFDDTTSPQTALKFMTDGILLRETLTSPDLDQYSVIIMDEAHERSLNTDILFGLLRDILSRRTDLRVIVTSATMDATKFSHFFGGAPILNIHGRTFPVETVYRPGMPSDYIQAAVDQVIKIHLQQIEIEEFYIDDDGHEIILPRNDIDQQDVTTTTTSGPIDTATLIKGEQHTVKKSSDHDMVLQPTLSPPKNGAQQPSTTSSSTPSAPQIIRRPVPTGDILVFMTGQDDIEATCHYIKEKMQERSISLPLWVLPISSTLPPEQQARIFAPSTIRKVIVATNIAETSLTVDGVRFVVDTGLCKLKTYDSSIGMDLLTVSPISQASARQRQGRAGRTSSGICYRLYTDHVFNNEMLHENIAEIYRTNLSSVVLTLTAIYKGDVLDFNFLERPSETSVLSSLYHLWILGALNDTGKLTPIGHLMTLLPLDPPLARMLLESIRYHCMSDILTICAMINVQNIFHTPPERESAYKSAHSKLSHPDGDFLTLLTIYNMWSSNRYSNKFATEYYLQYKSLQRAKEVRTQLSDFISDKTFIKQVAICFGTTTPSILQQHSSSTTTNTTTTSPTPPQTHDEAVRDALKLADKTSLTPSQRSIETEYRRELTSLSHIGNNSMNDNLDSVKRCICSGLFPNAAKVKTSTSYQSIRSGITCNIHPTSSLGVGCDYVVYQELVVTTNNFMRGVTSVDPSWLIQYGNKIFKQKRKKVYS